MTDLKARLRQLDLELPPAPQPIASYVPAIRAGNLLYISGQLPMRDGQILYTGRVPDDVTLPQARDCARQCVLNGLAVANDPLGGDWSQFVRIVRLGVFVNTAGRFDEMAEVANGASDLLVELFAEPGRHTRATTGAAALPLNAPVEIEMLVEVHQ